MQIQFLKYQKLNKSFLDYYKNEFVNNREYELLKKLIVDTNKYKNTVYVLEIDDKKVGVIGLTFDRVADSSVLSIDYLFVANSFRSKIFKGLYNKKISEIMLLYSLEIAKKIKKFLTVRYLAIYPDMQNQKLANYYLSLLADAFKLNENKETWILLKV